MLFRTEKFGESIRMVRYGKQRTEICMVEREPARNTEQILNSTDFAKNNLHRQGFVQSRVKRLA